MNNRYILDRIGTGKKGRFRIIERNLRHPGMVSLMLEKMLEGKY